MMHREVVERRGWLSEQRFLHALNYCVLLPGPEAQQLATYIGWLMHRTRGGIIAGMFFVLPSVFILLALSYIYAAYGNRPIIAGVLAGFKPVVVAIVVEAVLKIGQRAIKRRAHLFVAVAAFVAIYFLDVPFPLIVLAAGITGLVVEALWPEKIVSPSMSSPQSFQKIDADIESDSQSAATLLRYAIDDDLPLPGHTLPSRRRTLQTLAVGLALWSLPFAMIVAWRGFSSLHAQQYLFFTQAALVTFGGAYAVLSYVMQATVESYGWLTRIEAVDGLALAETTPGPLIMVLQFIGFMAGWNNPGGMNQTVSAVTGALVTTYATFLPGFIFVFLGAPYMETLRDNKSLSAALSGVTAAVVGVILNLAVVFGAAVLWPRGLSGEPDWFAAVISLLAFVLLYRRKLDVLWVVLAGGVIGLGRALLEG